ncbi:Tat-binding-like protein [Lachnellula cervina]|uniref:Tat-binding-like protein n=1 Tax=Lachnellula cervina TaxID=1316786 RepID=A0A7D8YZL1_9HELO|nr:Tat-binding-like protein [Lachnellula cervina]
MPVKRKLDNFDPNKSDSNDTDFDPTSSAPRKPSRKSRTKRTSGAPRKKTKYRGSDISDDDVNDSLDDLSISEPEEESEDIEMNQNTGRAVRKAAKKSVNYEENSESDADIVGDIEDSEDDQPKKRKQSKRSRATPDDLEDDEDEDARTGGGRPKRSKIVKLKINTPHTTRATRAGSAARSLRRRGSTAEPASAGIGRRSTRATSEAVGEEPIALSESGHHVLRPGHSPEPIGGRKTRGSKGLKAPAASTIKEELHESGSHEQEEDEDAGDVTMATEIAGTDDQDEPEADVEQPDAAGEVEEVADEGGAQVAAGDEDEDDDIPITGRRTRGSRAGLVVSDLPPEDVEDPAAAETAGGSRRLTRGSKSKQQKNDADPGSDFAPPDDPSEDELSASDAEAKKKAKDDEYESSPVRRGRRVAPKSKSTSRRGASRGSDADDLDEEELAEELQDLKAGSRRRRPRARETSQIAYERPGRQRKTVDYSIKPMDQIYAMDEAEEAASTPSRTKGGRSGASHTWQRSLFSTFGPFGGAGGPAPPIGGPWGTGATGGVDSDSSDEETMQRPTAVGGNVGMTPTSAMPPAGLLPGIGQTNPAEPMGGMAGTPANLGKVKSQKALADADPLGVDQNVDFSKIGGLEGHIDQLKEMVQMPLLYPELFMKFHVTPPRGVLFHGPPGTGKTLLARALAASVGSGGRKITFYMRKGADALSKWVGEAERQLRLLFEEARKTQPSIIFFDEIDGLAPVRSSKQEQIHASIVSTLLALMDGMDGRGQVIVIGATNRPDNIDPALRRPGRFDREFYFPLPDIEGRKSILNIHTKDWGLNEDFKNSLAHVTKGYGGADLRALCTEAALNSIQRTYPQIYSSNEKLIVDADKIKVTAKDFMLSVKKMIPSSERATSSGAAALPKLVEPLLRDQLKQVESILDGLVPLRKKTTALQEAMYEQYADADQGFARETMQQEFENSRVFRPRLLIGGEAGMGQAYLGGAILNHFEGLHVQNFDLPTIFSDSARSPEAAIVQLFAEVKRHKPSVIYIPGIDTWYHTLTEAQITTFLGLLRAIPPTDPVLVLGITDAPPDQVSPHMLRDLFGFSKKNRFTIERPAKRHREEFFSTIIQYVQKTPKEYPEPLNRKKRKLEVLEIAPPPPPKPPTKEEIKAQKTRDHMTLNFLKVQIQPVMDQIQKKYRKFRQAPIQQVAIQYLIDEANPDFVRPDIPQSRPFEFDTDKDGVKGLRETSSGKFYYNLDTTTIEERLSNGFYARPKDFLADIRSLAKDSRHVGDRDRILKANELVANVEVDILGIEAQPVFADCEALYQRQLQRVKDKEERHRKRKAAEAGLGPVESDLPATGLVSASQSGPLTLGEPVPGRRPPLGIPVNIPSGLSNGHSASNGTSVPSRSDNDVQMGGTDEHTQQTNENSQAMQPPSAMRSMASAPFNQTPVSQFSQRSALQEIPPGTSPSALINDASTTTSGKKTSDGWSTQATNGVSHGQASSPVDKAGADSQQLPDTQQGQSARQSQQGTSNPSSDEQWPHSQAHGLARGTIQGYPSQTPSSSSQPSQNLAIPSFSAPLPRASPSKSKPVGSIANILNDSPVEPTSSQLSSQKDAILDQYFLEDLLRRLVDGSSGCSIEQLEQLNRELMETLWAQRGEWNRNKVAGALVDAFNETIRDIEEMQKVLQASQPSQGVDEDG